MRDYRFVGCAILFFILTAGTAMADLFGKSSLTPDWVARFQDLSKLNAHTALQPAHLSNVAITGWDISGAKFPGARFDNTEWKDVKLERSVLINVTVSKSKLQGVNFDRSELTDVTFEDTELRSTSFYKAKLQRVRFVRCKFNGVTIDEMVGGTIDITDSRVLSSSLSDGQLIATIKGSKLKDVRLSDLLPPSSLSFEKSDLKEVKVDRSILTAMRAVDSHVDATFEKAKIDRVEFSNAELDVGLDESALGTLIVHASKITTLRMNTAHIGKVSISACTQTRNLGFYESTIGEMEIAQSALNDLDLADVVVESLTIRDTQLFNDDFKKLRAKKFILENVSLDKKIDFTGAQVESLKAQNVSKRASLQLITTDSNVKFD